MLSGAQLKSQLINEKLSREVPVLKKADDACLSCSDLSSLTPTAGPCGVISHREARHAHR